MRRALAFILRQQEPFPAIVVDRALAFPGVPTRWKAPDPAAASTPVLSMRLQRGDLSLAFFSTMTALATPQDVTLQQLRIECFHPADDVTEETARRLASMPPLRP